MMLITAAKILLALSSFQEIVPQTPGPMMWTGKGNGLYATDKDAPGYAAALRAELQALVTRTDVQRDYPAQLEKLEMLRGRACWSPAFPGKAELASEIAEVRADWFEKLGRHSDAVYAAHHALVMPGENNVTPYTNFDWVSSNGLQAELVNQIDALPRMVELRKRFPSDAPASKAFDAIEEAVRHEVLDGNPLNLKNFGNRCVPALVKILTEDPKGLSERWTVDYPTQPLAVLLMIDRASAESLILSTLGKRGPAWTMRAIYCLSSLLVTQQGLAPDADPYAPRRFSDPLTLRVVEAIASEAMPADRFFTLLEPLVGNDIVTPPIRDFLLAQVQATDNTILNVLRSMLDGVRRGPNKRVLYEAYLDSPDPDLRWRCAKALRYYPVGPATLRATQHSDPNVRSSALQALARHLNIPFDYQRNQLATDTTSSWQEVPRTPEIQAALLRLAKDPERSVRLELVQALQAAREAPPTDVHDALLADTEASVRAAATWGWDFDPVLQARVFGRMADDPDPQVLWALTNALWSYSPGNKPANAANFDAYLPALTKLLANPHLVLRENRALTNLLQAALAGGGGPRAVFDTCMHGPRKEELGPLLLDAIRWSANSPGEVAIYQSLDASAVAELFELACLQLDSNKLEWVRQSVQRSIESGALDAVPILALARDPARARIVRLRAQQVATVKAGPADAQAYLELLRGIKAEEVDPQQDTRALFSLALGGFRTNGWPAAALAGFAQRVLADTGVPDMLALRVAAAALSTTQEKLDAAGTGAAVQRWMRLESGEMWEASSILPRLDPGLDARVLAIWRAQGKVLWLAQPMLDALQAFPVDESIDLLIEIITRTDVAIDLDKRVRAVGLLARRLDERGAEALLRAIAAAPFENVRQQCFDGLEQIRKYQDEKQSWQKRKGGEAAREQAVSDLLPMLSDKDPGTRAAAARSLGTLRAVEHLPKLVALLKDKDAMVREAAQKALDALNTPESKKP